MIAADQGRILTSANEARTHALTGIAIAGVLTRTAP